METTKPRPNNLEADTSERENFRKLETTEVLTQNPLKRRHRSISSALRSEINAIAHEIARTDFVRHRDELVDKAVRMLGEGKTETEVFSEMLRTRHL